MSQSNTTVPKRFLESAAECLKVLAHPDRLRMVDILTRGERPVHEIAAICELPHHQACGHLRLMKGHGLLGSRRQGRLVLYAIADPRLPRILECVKSACDAAT